MNSDILAALKGIPIRRVSPISLPAQLSQGIENLLGNRVFAPGQRLPSINELAKITGVGPSTVRLAVADLVRRHLVYTKAKSGIYVTEARSGLTQILVSASFIGEPYRMLYFYQIYEGVGSAYADPGQRIMMTIGTKEMVAPEELVHDALAQGVDRVVALNPLPSMMAAFAKRAPAMGFVALLPSDPDPRVDRVEADPSDGLREVLLDRIVDGKRHFAYVAIPSSSGFPAHTLQRRLHRTFHEIMRAAHLKPIEIETGHESDFIASIHKLPRGCVVVAESARPVRYLQIEERNLDVVVCTDLRVSLDNLRDRCTVLYLGLELLAREAVALLKTTAERLATGQGRVRIVPAVIYRPDKAGQRTTDH